MLKALGFTEPRSSEEEELEAAEGEQDGRRGRPTYLLGGSIKMAGVGRRVAQRI